MSADAKASKAVARPCVPGDMVRDYVGDAEMYRGHNGSCANCGEEFHESDSSDLNDAHWMHTIESTRAYWEATTRDDVKTLALVLQPDDPKLTKRAPREATENATRLLASDWLTARVAAAVTEAREMAELSWQSQVKKYADMVDDYQRSIDAVQDSASERIGRARRERDEARAALGAVTALVDEWKRRGYVPHPDKVIADLHRALASVSGAVVKPDAPAPADDLRPLSALRDTGLLWLINRQVFHPRGWAIGLNFDDSGDVDGWVLYGDGVEPWNFEDGTENEYLAKVNALLAVRGAEGS